MRCGRIWAALLGAALVMGGCGGAASATTPASAAGTTPATGSPASATPASTTATSSTGGGSTGFAVRPGEPLCGLLGPGDFAAAGLPAAGVPTLNGDGSTEAYCVYAGTSAATGGLELDAFVSADAAGSGDVYTTVLGESGAGSPVPELSGVDAASINLDAEGTFATVAVQAGRLAFDIGIPKGAGARDQLLALAGLVLQRSAALR